MLGDQTGLLCGTGFQVERLPVRRGSREKFTCFQQLTYKPQDLPWLRGLAHALLYLSGGVRNIGGSARNPPPRGAGVLAVLGEGLPHYPHAP
jgi:hypothetical protein